MSPVHSARLIILELLFVAALAIAACLGGADTVGAAQDRIEGIVEDENGEPVRGARVGFGDQIEITGKDGAFVLDDIGVDGDEQIRVFAAGYAERSVKVTDLPKMAEADGAARVALDRQPIKAIYLNPLISTTEAEVNRLIELVDTTELNAIVVDIKEEIVLYDTEVALFREAGSVEPLLDVEALLDKFAEHDIYGIARLVVFKDSLVAEQFPDLAVRNSATGDLWRDMNGVAWVNPTNRDLWEANSDLAVEATRLGFEEIQYDYVRFATDGDLSVIDYGIENTQENREAAIGGFLKMSSDKLWPIGGKLSADVFGYTLLVNDDLGIGQNFVKLAKYVDYLSPMVYPSHFPEGSIDVDGHPNSYPYETIEISMSRAKEKLPGQLFKVRPWLQDFTYFDLPPEYGNDEVRAQIDAAEDVGTSGWMLWDPNNVYRDGALRADEETSSSTPADASVTLTTMAVGQVTARARRSPRVLRQPSTTCHQAAC